MSTQTNRLTALSELSCRVALLCKCVLGQPSQRKGSLSEKVEQVSQAITTVREAFGSPLSGDLSGEVQAYPLTQENLDRRASLILQAMGELLAQTQVKYMYQDEDDLAQCVQEHTQQLETQISGLCTDHAIDLRQSSTVWRLSPSSNWVDRSDSLYLNPVMQITQFFTSASVSCQVSFLKHELLGDICHLWLRRDDERPMGWSQLQRCKNELVGPEKMALQVFPREGKKVDKANMYHLWVLRDGDIGVSECGFNF